MTRRPLSLVLLVLSLVLVSCKDGSSPTEPFGETTRATLEGTLTSQNGYSVGGGIVALWRNDRIGGSDESDGYGLYKITGLLPGHYHMYVYQSRFLTTSRIEREIDIHEGVNKLDIVIP